MARQMRRPLVVLLAVLLAASACGNANKSSSGAGGAKVKVPTNGGEANRKVVKSISDVPGVSDKEIAYAVVGTKQNNPLGICILDCYANGIKAYFAYRNSQGGIYGRKLTIEQTTDDELGKNQSVNLDIISQKKAFGTFQAGLLQLGWGDLDQAGVPTYTWGISGGDAANRKAIFPSIVARCPDCTRRIFPYLAKTVGAKHAAALGYGTSQNSQVCADSEAESFKRYTKESGVTFEYLNDHLTYGLPDGVGPDVTAMKKAGVDFLATCLDANGMKTVAQELKRQGMSNVVLYHLDSYNQSFITDAGTLFEGNIVEAQFRPFEADSTGSALDAFRTWMAKQGSPLTELSMVGWINATLAYEGLLAAGPEFDQAKVLAATNAMKNFTADGLIPSTDWSQAHTPYTQATRTKFKDSECAADVRVVKGKFTTMAPKDKPWLCWNSQDLTWSEPVPTNYR